MSDIIDTVDISAITDAFETVKQQIQYKVSNTVKIAGFATLLSMASIGIFSEAKAQTPTFNFDTTNFNVVNNTNGGFKDLGLQGTQPNRYHQYRLFEAQQHRPPGSLFMHHNTSLDMSKPFVFSAKVWYDPYLCTVSTCHPIPNYWGSGFTFSLLSSSARSEVGMRGKYLGYGWTDSLVFGNLRDGASHLDSSFAVAFVPGANNDTTSDVGISFLKNGNMTSQFPSKTISITYKNWYCFDVVWRYANNLDATGGFVMEVYWEDSLKLSQPFASYQNLGLTSQNAVWGISTGVDTLPVPSPDKLHCAEQRIQFVRMENGDSINIPYQNQTTSAQ
ncbi:MAG: hypothetical protein LBE46_04615 [Wolbachia pipientis]|jgi:hypothetical protein|nr:hypothetical protein [Wolbachia pipientis]